ncbi:U2 small nuclear ribonucleoprotein A' [Cimex lectularius]|uniref:Probable U2 small nuclear ribonucleoprotein A' n=1 Tax=Cimex lectularius TaxID=79782 RepID=A0A8I6S487_CIMLE|nr:U2 small nuclear ribonucleoprotein A' [Cimex lectularius]
MVKLTPDLIQQALQYINPVRDRELDLRGYKIPVIENLGASLDQFDTIDFSDNDIRKLDGFPLLKRLKCLLMNNNRIVRIGDNLGETLPNLESLILTGNMLQELSDIDPLTSLTSLRSLSLMHCPLVTKQHYRHYVAFKLPNLRLLDFRKIKEKEREEANSFFKSKVGRALQREFVKKTKTFVPGGNLAKEKKTYSGPTKAEVAQIRAAIARATSLEEVERLNRMLQSGQFNFYDKARNGSEAEEEEVEEQPENGRMEE